MRPPPGSYPITTKQGLGYYPTRPHFHWWFSIRAVIKVHTNTTISKGNRFQGKIPLLTLVAKREGPPLVARFPLRWYSSDTRSCILSQGRYTFQIRHSHSLKGTYKTPDTATARIQLISVPSVPPIQEAMGPIHQVWLMEIIATAVPKVQEVAAASP